MSQQEWNKRFPEENNKTLKKVIIALLTVAILAPGVFAWGLRVDIKSNDRNMKLTPIPLAGDNALRHIFWGNEALHKSNLFYQRKDLPDGITAKLKFKFIPSASGNVKISLNGCWVKRKGMSRQDKQWVDYLSVEVEGATLHNGHFTELVSGKKLKYWYQHGDAVIIEKGVKAWNKAPVVQTMKIKAGQVVTVTLTARNGGTELAKPPVQSVTFHHKNWKLIIDGSNGIWKSLTWSGKSIYSNPDKNPPFFLSAPNTQTGMKLVKHSIDPATGVANIITRNEFWSFAERLTLGKRLKREVTVTYHGKEPVKFRGFSFYFYLPKSGSYYFPRSLFGDVRHYMRIADNPQCKPADKGWLDKAKNGTNVSGVGNCYFSFVQQAPDQTLMFAFDGRKEKTSAKFGIRKNYVLSDTYVGAAGWAMPGRSQYIGPAFVEVIDGDVKTALRKATHTWFRDIGMLPPADRPGWIEDITSIWCFSPTPKLGGVNGFVSAVTNIIPYAKARGANAFWILPLQPMGYAIRDYYKFRPDVGSKEEFKKFLGKAKNNGFHTWQDIVPHGLFAEYGYLRGVSPFTISITEKGTYPNKYCYDYSSKEWRKYICDVAEYYTKNFPIDGFRIDQCSHSPLNWRRPGFPTAPPKMSDPRYWDSKDVAWWNKSLAEWWNDAVKKNGGTVPAIDGQRASSSRTAGGVTLTREIRDTVRKIRRDGAVLGETEEISCVPSSDAIFDFYIRRVGLKMFLYDGENTAREFARFLEEQKLTDPPDTIRVRFLEVHDSQQQRYTNWCGEKAGRALKSAVFWSRGIPLQLASTDIGMGTFLKKLNNIRAALPEFRLGAAEYQAVKSAPAVFSVLRGMKGGSSVGISSFLPEAVETALDIPIEKLGFAPGSKLVLYNTWTGEKLREGTLESFKKIKLNIPAYGNAVLTWRPKGSACPVKLSDKLDYTQLPKNALTLKETPDEIIVNGTKKLVIKRRSGMIKSFGDWLDGSSILADHPLAEAPAKVTAKLENGKAIISAALACGAEIYYILDGTNLKITTSLKKFSKNERMAFVLAGTEATRWKVYSIEGTLDDFIDKSTIDPNFISLLPNCMQSYRPVWSPILWHSEIKPLNPTLPVIQFFNKDKKGFEVKLESPLSPDYDDLMLFNRLPGRSGLHLAVFWVQPGPLSLAGNKGPRTFTINIRPAQKIKPSGSCLVDNIKISHKSMFWDFNNGKYSLRIARNGGAIKDLKAKDGRIVFSEQNIIGGTDISKPTVKATLDLDTGVRIFSENNKLKLRFISALRNGANSGLPTPPLWAVTDYVLDSSDIIEQICKVYVKNQRMKLAYVAKQGSEKLKFKFNDKNGRFHSQKYNGFSTKISSTGSFSKSPLEPVPAPELDWKRFYQIYSSQNRKPLPLMIASFVPGSSMISWYTSDTRFAAGYKAPASVETRMPGFSFFARFVNLKPGKYRLKTWIKGKEIAKKRGRCAILLWMSWREKNKNVRYTHTFKIPDGSFDWKPFEAEFDIPADAQMPIGVYLRTSFDALGTGTVWADLPELIKVK